MLKNWYNRLPKFLKNKFFWTGIIFIVWIVYFDNNNLISIFKNKKELKELKVEKNFYKQQISKDSAEYQLLISDTFALEKIAREKYQMKKDNEDVYVIVRQPASDTVKK